MKQGVALTVVLIALGLLALACILVHRPVIEADLTDRSRQALSAVGGDEIDVRFRGRDATLEGAIASEGQRAALVGAVRSERGVRVVRDRLSLAVTPSLPAPPPAAQALSLTAERRGGRVLLRGVLPSEELRSAVRVRARALPGVEVIDDEIQIRRDLSVTDWTGRIPLLIQALASTPEQGKLQLRDAVLSFEGQARDEAQRARAVALLRDTVGASVDVRDRLQVPAPPAGETPEQLQISLDQLLKGSPVEFERSSDVLTPRGRRVLDQAAALLKGASPVPVEISGHTDARGDAARNLELSRHRADSVRSYLASLGLDADGLLTLGVGSLRPIADNSTAEGRQRNRRIELRVLAETER